MKTTLLLSSFVLIFVITLNLNECGAIVASGDTQQQVTDETLTGMYQGYKNQTIVMQLKDGTRRSYPVKADEALWELITKTRLARQVTISVKKGVVVRFQEVSR